jgi:predicted DNA-binding transcriptional regulator AlpA
MYKESFFRKPRASFAASQSASLINNVRGSIFCFINSKRSICMLTTIPATGFLRLPQILAIFPISKSAWWECCRTGRYLKPIKLGPRPTVWRAEEIYEFIRIVSDGTTEPML